MVTRRNGKAQAQSKKPSSAQARPVNPGENAADPPVVESPCAALRHTIREEKVAHAKRLVADPNYPPEEVIQSLTIVLARNWCHLK